MDLTIKQVSEITGLSADTLRYYEKEGIIKADRHENGYRRYDENDIMILKYVVVMKYANFTLAEIKSMASLFSLDAGAGAECNGISKGILGRKIMELKQTIQNYKKIIKLMEESLPIIDGIHLDEKNLEKLDSFIGQIFDDIRKGEFEF